MWSVAVKTLVADRGKLLTALVGVCFAVVLVNIQGGLFLGMIRKASMLVDHGQADIWVGHKKMINIDFPRDIPRRWIYRIKGLPGVARAEPYLVGVTEMTLPSGGYELAVVVGVDEASLLGNTWNIQHGTPLDIRKTDGIITDVLEAAKLEYPEIGERREIGAVRAKVVAQSRGVMGFGQPLCIHDLRPSRAILKETGQRLFLFSRPIGAGCRPSSRLPSDSSTHPGR